MDSISFSKMEKNIFNEIEHKRVSELRKENIPTIVLSRQLSVLQKYQNNERLLSNGVDKTANETALKECHPYLKQDGSNSDYSSKGCISKIPLIPTVTFYVLVIIIIGMALAFNEKKSRLKHQEINIDDLFQVIKRIVDRGKGKT